MKGIFVLVLVLGMLFTGTVNTILNKLQDMTCVENCEDPDTSRREYFEQPLWQTLNMFVGEALCLLVYYIGVYLESRRSSSSGDYQPVAIHPEDPTSVQADTATSPNRSSTESTPLIAGSSIPPLTGTKNLLLWLPTLCDMTATTLMNVGLIHVSASIYQMLRGSVVLFTGTLSVYFLGRKHPLYRWFALIMVFLGVAVVGLSSIIEKPDPNKGPVKSSFTGVLLVVLAQTFTALQFVIEEKIMGRYELPAIKAVGLEGLFGLVSVGLGMPVLYYAFGVGTGNFFDLPVGFHQLFSHAQILYAGIGIIFSIAFFNWFGLSVTRSISATSRSTIDTCRTLFIWMISLGLGWENFRWLQVVGFVILIYGTFLFNDVVSPPPLHACRRPVVEDADEIVEP
ncbi:uncharacterized protein SPPG_06687 [Spizellomyces punctatus DAOM BR117]|uniref:Integral membrane protein n=1 Tax=Spizellomyces punctatus (strain DAOM BR117) TaxID=645134 RepID=A0A0L0HBH3_SPIPD|nr:uncharacterized protein SPPG_06687 [Spizellomyces punctatus DAOM BR117]KNC98291.1 hypothetical protein SPPG_06687 [Spizellomyces punctatus DAOM BR117]|eukprot:XP_016606331.1 hypothetical protein SPPG_06687 [Spizellomyces punctatus DAOM BR117]